MGIRKQIQGDYRKRKNVAITYKILKIKNIEDKPKISF